MIAVWRMGVWWLAYTLPNIIVFFVSQILSLIAPVLVNLRRSCTAHYPIDPKFLLKINKNGGWCFLCNAAEAAIAARGRARSRRRRSA